eukprot:CAMPEP_0206532502 /NCGR_PEP_ID=MMETSP0325_2-20121206/4421_1 /ASSEMBLY_ACC=CAM_ASM_000347 /TAXON_ID=2866 /ORGANISM="Crypthecodinium cohnii, Strain Seligo" /LENGTH=337 /DNA_ID=CAMNT_0054028993 /DNA_START=28 /DNA_END=1038 /DNA_ORIENTATION=-
MRPVHACGDGVGSDEFLVMLKHLTEASSSPSRALVADSQRMDRAIARPFRYLWSNMWCLLRACQDFLAWVSICLTLFVVHSQIKLALLCHALTCCRCSERAGEVGCCSIMHWNMIAALVNLKTYTKERAREQQAVSAFLSKRRISATLCLRVRAHVDRARPERVTEDNADQIRRAAAELMIDLLEEMFVPPFSSHPFFVNLRGKHPHLVKELCQEALQPLLKAPDDVIFTAGEVCSKMYVIISGHVQYCATVPQRDAPPGSPPAIVKRTLRGGQWLSEAALWTGWVHRGELRAVTDSLLFALDAAGFARVISSHKSAHTYAAAYARKFVEGLNRGLQ